MRTNMNYWRGLIGVLAAVHCLGATTVRADSLSNYMGGDWSASWSNEANWAAVTPYPSETFDGLGGEIEQISIAHDNSYLYIFFDEGSAFNYEYGSQNIYFDTDLNAATGDTTDFWWWVQSMGGVGAEHSMYGPAIWHHGDAAWTGDSVDSSASNSGNHLIQINRSKLGDPSSFNWVGRMFGSDDYYPDEGSSHHYDMSLPTVTAFGREWTTVENPHRDNPAVVAEIVGAANSLTFTGVFGSDTNAMTPLTVEVGTKVSYDMALTHDFIDPIGNGTEAWVGDAFGAFVNSADNPSNSNLLTVRTGVVPGDDEATRIQYNDINQGELGFASLEGFPLANGVHIEWLFTSANEVEISVYSPDGNTLLGPAYLDEIEAGISSIEAFRLNLYDSEQTMTITNFLVEQIDPVPGDYNGNGIVDAADYTLWRDSLNQTGVGLAADGTGPGLNGIPDGVVDANDYNFWKANFGNGAGSGAAASGAVPEPSSLALVGMVLALVAVGRRRDFISVE